MKPIHMQDSARPPSDDGQKHESDNMTGWVVMAVVLACAAAALTPMVKRQRIKANQTSAISSLRQIGLSLYEFESDYGRFPDSTTATDIKRKTGSSLTFSDRTSNDIFVQLLATGLATSESVFATHSQTTRNPDGDWHSDATALEPSETGFAYISGLTSKDNPAIPIVFGPAIPATKTIDAKSFEDRAVALKLDNSVSSLPINSAGKIIIDGLDLLDPRQPFWHGKAPDVKWPK